jgi:hypothetical protein
MTASEFNFSAHSPQFVGGPLDGSAYSMWPTVQAVEMNSGTLVCRYTRIDKHTFVFEKFCTPPPTGPEVSS